MSETPPMNMRAMPSQGAAFDALEQRGCGAWVADHGCGAVPVDVVIGQTELFFATYINLSPAPGAGETVAFLCERHHPEKDPKRLIADMDPKILWGQRRELRKAFKLMGRTLGKPNLLEPL